MSFHAKLAWHGFDGLVRGCMRSQHGTQLPACILELHHLAWWVVAHDVATQGGHLGLIEGCPQLCTRACTACILVLQLSFKQGKRACVWTKAHGAEHPAMRIRIQLGLLGLAFGSARGCHTRGRTNRTDDVPCQLRAQFPLYSARGKTSSGDLHEARGAAELHTILCTLGSHDVCIHADQ